MFQERESGEPRSWGCLIFIVAAVTFMNLVVVMTIRILLDSEDEINEPIIKGESPTVLAFWWALDCPRLFSKLITAASYKFISSHPSLRRKFRKEDEEDIVIEDVVVAARGIPHQTIQRQPTDLRAYENPIPFEHFIEPEAIVPQSILQCPPGRMRSYSIDVSYK
ncbi:unnamed protein product [Nippostrongylus brasiliensis]|uniref:Ion_trans domain-containing protein n=1 Tax=Nippostrongylus brasiliensis TaxID=27835 RepID=A0A0N4YW79_NIPBR|nr:unnamed protein product [Nippostrongylus brasiliensis]